MPQFALWVRSSYGVYVISLAFQIEIVHFQHWLLGSETSLSVPKSVRIAPERPGLGILCSELFYGSGDDRERPEGAEARKSLSL